MSLKESLAVQRNYFTEYSHEIALRNLKLMRTVCYVGIIIFILYYIVTFFFFPSVMIPLIYGIIVPILLGYLLRIRQLLKHEDIDFVRSQGLTFLMYATMMLYILIMSIVPHPDMQAVYYPLFLLLGPVMFIMPVFLQLLMNGCSYILFVVGVIQFKAEICWMHDLFESFTALLFSAVVILLMTQFRVQSDDLKNKYYSLSRHDGLTGLLNKTAGTMLTKDYVENRFLKERFTVVLLDVDEFKKINDTYGHEKGDVILEEIGKLLGESFRKNDIVSRFGGDEFLILMKDITKADADQKLTDLAVSIQELSDKLHIKVTCSMGAYDGATGSGELEQILQCADEALYEVKRNGRNHHRYYVRKSE